MLVYEKESKFIVFMTDGEYDDFRKIPVCVCDTMKEATKVVKELNDIHKLVNLGEYVESEVWNDVANEYAPSNEAEFNWEEFPAVSFKED